MSGINTNLGNLIHRSNQWFVYGSESHGRFATIRSDDYHRGYSFTLGTDATTEARYLGTKFYELKDHLGNVRVVLKDWKLNPNSDGLPPFTAQPEEVFNYYAFGMLIPGFFSNSDPDYRFGFNGMLRDDDVRDKNATYPEEEGRGNSYDFGARVLNPRVGSWLSLDPLRAKYPSVSAYVFVLNNPINYIDPDGRETTPAIDEIRDIVLESYNSILQKAESDEVRLSIMNEISVFNIGYSKLQTSKIKYDMGDFDTRNLATVNEDGSVYYSKSESAVKMDLRHTTKLAGGLLEFSANALHEFQHMFQFENGKISFQESGRVGGLLYDQMDEVEAFDAMKVFGFGNDAYEFIGNVLRFKGNYDEYNSRTKPIPIIDLDNNNTGLFEGYSIYNLKGGDINAAKELLNQNENLYNTNIEQPR